MNYLAKFYCKRKIKNIFVEEKNEKENVSTSEILKDCFQDIKGSIEEKWKSVKDYFNTECKLPYCHLKAEKKGLYCKYHNSETKEKYLSLRKYKI